MRVYDKSSLNPRGNREDVTRCISEVSDGTHWHFLQCSRKRGHGPDGLYCKQHGKIETNRLAWRGFISDAPEEKP